VSSAGLPSRAIFVGSCWGKSVSMNCSVCDNFVSLALHGRDCLGSVPLHTGR
jgi:hypothetical protein